jgi:serine/threonine protein kinase/tetratricopeptide (TPR) repeat protein
MDWSRVSDIVASAAELPPDRRDAFVREACAGDAALEREVRSLLDHHGPEPFLPTGGAGPAMIRLVREDGPGEPGPGQRIGAWRLVRPLGEGGMGVVWLVERDDAQFTQRGALKLIRSGFATEEMVRRFRRERQILAALEHPNIARLIDGGSTGDGLPFLVMEHVDGVALHEYVSRHAPSVAERLRLFLAICSAVEYAHQRLVLHRDLKPGNVIVQPDGVPKLLDFGVAKIVDDAAATAAGDLRTVAVPFTPEYASPEQLEGRPATTATDLYALGVLLYELLTGAHPFGAGESTPVDLLRAIRDTDPDRPSARATRTPAPGARPRPSPPEGGGEALRRRLEGDLDTIVLKALHKDPARRYASVSQFAEDVRRHMAGLPVFARPDSWRYRASKFVRRNRVAVALGVIAVTGLLVGLGLALWQAGTARRESAAATRRLREVQSLTNTLLFDVYDQIQGMPGASAVRANVVRKAAGFLDVLAADAGRDSSVRFGLAEAYGRLGDAQLVVAEGDARRSLERSDSLFRGLQREFPTSERAAVGRGESLARLGNMEEREGRSAEALDHMRRASALADSLSAAMPARADLRATTYRRSNSLAYAQVFDGHYDAALPPARRAIAGFTAIVSRPPVRAEDLRLLGMSTTVLAEAYFETEGRLDSSMAAERRALACYLECARLEPDNVEMARRVADAHARMNSIYSWMNLPDSAIAHAELAQAIIGRVSRDDPRDRRLAISVATARVGLAFYCAANGRISRAEYWLDRARPDLERWWASGLADVYLSGTRGQAAYAQALIAEARAKRTTGAASLAAWRQSRAAADSALAEGARDSTGMAQPGAPDWRAGLRRVRSEAERTLALAGR